MSSFGCGFRPVICTVASQSHIGQFAVLLKSVFRYHDAVAVCLLVIDADAAEARSIDETLRGYVEAGDRFDLSVVTLEEAYDAETAERLRFCYDAFELCNIARGGLHRWMHERTSYDAWVYLDGDMVCFAPLDTIFRYFDGHDLLVFAHWGAPGSVESDLILLKYGPYNGGLLGVRRGAVGERFVRWFFDRMLHFGRVDTRLPLNLQPDQRFAFFADQTWLTLVPIYFETTATLRHRGLNCGPWNVNDDEFALDGRGLAVGGDSVTLLHLSGWSPEAPNVLCNYLPRDMSANAWWQSFIPSHCAELSRAQALFKRPYKYARYLDGTEISPYQRRAFLKLESSGRRIAQSPFASPDVVGWLAADFDTYDYVAPGFRTVTVDRGFPGMIEVNRHRVRDPWFRSEIPHKRYADIRNPQIGFLSRDEAMLLFNTALRFAGKSALEIGCWAGWSTCHLAAAGVVLDVVDPALAEPAIRNGVAEALAAMGREAGPVALFGHASPAAVTKLGREGRRWSLIFIDGNPEAPAPVADVAAAEKFVAEDAVILVHDLARPGVAAALDYLRDCGWETAVYATAQIVGVAWRGSARPVRHMPDPRVRWAMPPWLNGYRVSS